MIEVIILLVVLGLAGCVLVLPLVALVRTQQIPDLRDRLERVERELRRLRRSLEGPAVEALPAEPRVHTEVLPEEALPSPRPAARRPGPEPPAAEAVPATATGEEVPEPEVLTARPVRPAQQRPAAPAAATLESWIGRQGLGWAAVVLLLFATAFFLKYAFENAWIGELGRVSLGILAGAGLCLAGLRYHRQGWRLFSQMLTAAGVVLLYLATFSAFGYYHLLPQGRAALFLIALVAETAALAVLYEAPAIALMAVIGGLLTPVLLHTDRDQYRNLFTYLVVLDAGVVGLALFRRWRTIAPVALLGTQALFWAWYFDHYHPEKLSAALLFQGAVFLLFLVQPVVGPVWRRASVHVEGLLQQVVNAFLFALAGYVLLDPDYHPLMGSLALGLAIVYTALAWVLLRRRPEDPWHVLVAVATGLAFLAAVFPLQADAGWIAVGWAVEGLALWWFGLRVRLDALRGFGVVLLALAAGRLLFVDTPWDGRDPFVPLFNSYALPALAVAACVAGTSLISRRFRPGARDSERVIQVITGLTGVLLIWLVLSVETYQYFTAQVPGGMTDDALHWVALMALSVLWAVYAGVLLALGFRLESVPLRWAGLGLLGVTLAKVILVDMAGLPGIYRVVAFFILSLVMGAAAWGYQKLEATRRPAQQEVVDHAKA